jgi:hypothetical protein
MNQSVVTTHYRTFEKMSPNSQRRCECGCNQRATHIGKVSGVGVIIGCELTVRRWAKRRY